MVHCRKAQKINTCTWSVFLNLLCKTGSSWRAWQKHRLLCSTPGNTHPERELCFFKKLTKWFSCAASSEEHHSAERCEQLRWKKAAGQERGSWVLTGNPHTRPHRQVTTLVTTREKQFLPDNNMILQTARDKWPVPAHFISQLGILTGNKRGQQKPI